MECYCCQAQLIAGGDHEAEADDEHDIVTNLGCPDCKAFVLVYWSISDNRSE